MHTIALFSAELRRLIRSRSRRLMVVPGMLILLAVSQLASAQVPPSAPYVSYAGPTSYSVSYLCPATVCYLEESTASGWQYIDGSEAEGPYGGGAAFYYNQPEGTYAYRVVEFHYPSGMVLYGNEAYVAVPQPPPPPPPPSYAKPKINFLSWYAVGSPSSPIYYSVSWSASSLTNPAGCALVAQSYNSYSQYLGSQVWTGLPLIGTVNVGPGYSGTRNVFIQLQCTNQGGTSYQNGGFLF